MKGLLAALLVFHVAAAWGQDAAGPSPCPAAAAQAEAEAGLPRGLLSAIGRVESGRWNPVSRQTEAWPWTANASGTGRYFATREDALTGVRNAQANGYQSIDVGCFQVNLVHHPAAFATLDDALDPLANARYAARFLATLRSGAGSWDAAIGQYHSATPGLGEPYRQRVLAAWDGGAATAGQPVLVPPQDQVRAAPMPPLERTARVPQTRPMVLPVSTTRADPHVLLIRPNAMPGVRAMGADPHVVSIATRLAGRRG